MLQQAEGAQHPDEVGGLTRLAAFEADEGARGDASLARELGLREVALQPQLGKAVAEVLEDGGVGWGHEKL